MQDTDRPPRDVLLAAQRRASASGRAVYLYRDGRRWAATAKLRDVPAGAATLEVRPAPDHPDLNNTGGC